MSDPEPGDSFPANANRGEVLSALFANMILQQANMALIFLGKAPHPETGERVEDIETARMFIDQLEMLEAKTKGNLDKREEAMLKQSLTAVRMAFVETVDKAPLAGSQPKTAAAPAPGDPATAEPPPAPRFSGPEAAAESDSRKKFSKRY